MAITLVANKRLGGGYVINGYSADWSGCEVLMSAPGAGKAIVLLTAQVCAESNTKLTIGEGETVPGTIDTILAGPLDIATDYYYPVNLGAGVVLSENTALVADSVTAVGPATVIVTVIVIDI